MYGNEPGFSRISTLTEKIIGVFYDVYNELGNGFLASTYAGAMAVIRENPRQSVAKVSA
ncbi:MAG TPA: GxxExxY protein [Candidatus Sulfotelmatobacter sp.]